MSDPRQAERERQARELWTLLEGAGPYFGPTKDLPVKAIVEVLKAIEAATLEEAAKMAETFSEFTGANYCDGNHPSYDRGREHDYGRGGNYVRHGIAEFLRAQAQVRRA